MGQEFTVFLIKLYKVYYTTIFINVLYIMINDSTIQVTMKVNLSNISNKCIIA